MAQPNSSQRISSVSTKSVSGQAPAWMLEMLGRNIATCSGSTGMRSLLGIVHSVKARQQLNHTEQASESATMRNAKRFCARDSTL
jgi:hypothetical protein